jgi:LacI family transcriptional regulator
LPVRDLGRIAANMLLAVQRGQMTATADGISVTPHLIVRDSCQPPRT